jgi:hypothetical protein
MRVDTVQADPEVAIAADAVARLARDRAFARYRTWLETQHSYPEDWRRAADEAEAIFWLTPDELGELNADLQRLLERHLTDRLTDPTKRPAGALPVELLLVTYPIRPPRAG